MIVASLRPPKGRPAGDTDSTATHSAKRSLREGWDVLRRSPQLYGPIIPLSRSLMVPCAGVLALLPLEAKENIQTGAIGYGGLLAALGAGLHGWGVFDAAAAASFPAQRDHPTVAVAVFSLAVVGISRWDSMLLDATFLVFFGFTWSALSVSHQYAVQIYSPGHMRGLIMSICRARAARVDGCRKLRLRADRRTLSVRAAEDVLLAGFVAMSGLLLVRRYPMPENAPERATG